MILVIVFILIILIMLNNIVYYKKDYNNEYLSKGQTNCLKGICATFILLHHICLGTKDLIVFLIPMKYIGFIMVSIFLFISGYGLMSGLLNKENYLKGFLKKRLVKLLVPYIFVVCIYAIIVYFTDKSFNIFTYIMDIVLARRIGSLWFMTTIIILYIIFYVIFKLCTKERGIKYFLTFTVIYGLVLILFSFQSSWYASILSFWFGLYYKFNEAKILKSIKSNFKKGIIISTVSFIILFSIRLILKYEDFGNEIFHGIMRNIISIMFIIMVLHLLLKFRFNNIIISFLGTISYEIYLIHPFIISYLGNDISMNSFQIIIIILSTIMLAYLLNLSYNRLLKNKLIVEKVS